MPRKPPWHRPCAAGGMADVPSGSASRREEPLGELLGRLAEQGTELLEARISLARAELASDLEGQLHRLRVVVAAMLLALCGLQLVVVALVLALATRLDAWLATLLVSVPFLIAGAALFLTARSPAGAPFLAKTLQALKEDGRWLKSLAR